jgi:Recombination endonuclease VII
MSDNVNNPKHYLSGRNRPWSERRPLATKACGECGESFQPYCGADKFCHPCRPKRSRSRHQKAMRTYRENNRDHVRRVKANWDLKQFGLTIEGYESLLRLQNHCCAICKEDGKGRGRGVLRPLSVDHCHTNGKTRGLLCGDCNTAIGLLRENVSNFQNAITYLISHQHQEVLCQETL